MKPERCPECGSPVVLCGQWAVVTRNAGEAVDGRLRLHDVAVDFVLGCDECSTTILTVPADEIARSLSS